MRGGYSYIQRERHRETDKQTYSLSGIQTYRNAPRQNDLNIDTDRKSGETGRWDGY